MKASISNRIYLKCDEKYHRHILDNLTYKIPPRTPNGAPEVICDVYRLKDITSFPVGRFDLIPEGTEIIDRRLEVPVDFTLNPDVKFRENQQQAIDFINDNGIINAKPAWGKTFTSCGVAAKLQQKTLVVVHTVFLRDQWEKESEFILGQPPGIIGSGRFEIDRPFVIGNVQTLTGHMQKLANQFGLIIVDECHHTPASTFKKVLDLGKARYKVGLTATMGRKDKKHVVIPDYFSDNIFVASDSNSLKPKVYQLFTDIPLDSNPMTPWGIKVNKLVANPRYKDLIVEVAKTQARKGHKVLAVSDRVDFLDFCNGLCQSTELESDLIIGSTKNREEILNELREGFTDIIWGSQKIFCEGISENSLSCLILGSPTNNMWLLEQLCGRVTRKAPGKRQPIIIDVILKGTTGKNQATTRENFYINKGWEIEKL